MPVARGDAVALTRTLVRVDSRNPTLVPGAPGEAAVARALREVLESWGLRAELSEAAPGRPNVVARVAPASGGTGRTLLFNGHLDVVDVIGMVHAPFDAEERAGALYGRGAADMKGGVAAMCAAAVRALDDGLAGEIVVAAVADEEYSSLGTRALVEHGVRADAAVVTEPTALAIMPAHRGFVWVEIAVHGRAAHGSRWEIGVDAIRLTGLLLAELDRLDVEVLPARPAHPLLGRPSVHASLIEGGAGMSTYPELCILRIERRTLPGEKTDQVLAEVQDACEKVRERHPEFRAVVRPMLAQEPSDVATDAPIVRGLERALRACGEPVRVEGMSAWTDAALLNEAGIPAICFGPGDIMVAHAAEEYIRMDEIERATRVLTQLALEWNADRVDAWHS